MIELASRWWAAARSTSVSSEHSPIARDAPRSGLHLPIPTRCSRSAIAEARADQIGDEPEAKRQIRRALESDDAMLVKAIARKAHQAGWASVATLGVDVELLRELSRL